MEKEMVQDHEKQPAPTSVGRKGGRRVQNVLGSASASTNNRLEKEKQDTLSVTLVETIIGCHFIGLRIKRYVYPPGAWRFTFGYRSYGEHQSKQISIHCYSDPVAAACAYRSVRRSLGLGLLPFRDYEQPRRFVMMGSALLTAAAADTTTGRDAAACLRKLGVYVSDEPLDASNSQEYWWADCAMEVEDARA
jgi:hypothetical protein